MLTPLAATTVYLLAGGLWLSSLGGGLDGAAWPLLLFSGALVHALFRRTAERSPAEREAEVAATLDDLAGPVLIAAGDGRLLRWNRAAEAFCGFDEGWHARPLAEAFAAADRDGLARALAEGSQGFAARLQAEDGATLPCRWAVGRNADGQTVLHGVVAAPGDREAALAAMLDATAELAAVVVDGRIALINRAGAMMLGAGEVEQAIGMPWCGTCEPDKSGTCHLPRLGGGGTEVRCSSAPIMYAGRGALLVQARDVTELSSAQRARVDEASRSRLLLDAIPEAVLTLDRRGVIQSCNAATLAMFGVESHELVGKPLDQLLPASQRESHARLVGTFMASPDGTPLVRTVNARRKDGKVFPARVNVIDVPQARGRMVAAVVTDLSERQQIESRLLVAEKVLESTVEGVMVTDPRGMIQWVNNAFCTISGFERDEVIGENASLLKSGFQGLDFYKTMWQQIRSDGQWQGEIWNRRKDGEAYLEWLTIKAVSDEAGTIKHFVGVFSDISRHKRAEETIKHLTYYDGVTRLPNRYLFRDRVAQAIERAQRGGRMVALVLVSLDRFKQVNETLGHSTGDALLREVAQRLARSVRGQDTVARLRGDSFCCVLTDLAHGQDATPVVSRVIDAFGTAFNPNGHELFATASIGISAFPVDGADVDELVQKAETAMNRSKDKAENTFQFYTPEMNANNRERLRLETDLRKAVTNGDLVLYYQPKVETVSGRLVGSEALVRWQHAELGMIPPGKFIPIAEETGLILQVGHWVLQAACLQIKAWQRDGLPPQRVAVNLSAHQFRQPELVETVVRVLDQTGVDPNLIELELTESAVMHNADVAVRRMLDLHEAGIRLAIDDFGTGYSSLSHLKRFPLDKLKIDRSFIQDIGSNAAGEEIVSAILAMAHSLNLSVVAEGVETAAQLEVLRRMRCDEIQGFYFSPPVPAPRFAEFVARGVLKGGDTRGA